MAVLLYEDWRAEGRMERHHPVFGSREREREIERAASEQWPGFIALHGINQPEAPSVVAAKVKTCFSKELQHQVAATSRPSERLAIDTYRVLELLYARPNLLYLKIV